MPFFSVAQKSTSNLGWRIYKKYLAVFLKNYWNHKNKLLKYNMQ